MPKRWSRWVFGRNGMHCSAQRVVHYRTRRCQARCGVTPSVELLTFLATGCCSALSLLQTSPKWNPGHSVLGHCFVALGQTKDAKSAFQHALSSCSTDTNSSTAISRLDKGELVACPIVAKAVLAMKGVKNKEMQESKDSDNLTRVHKEDTIGGASSGKKKEKGRRKTSKYVPFSPTAAAKAHAFSEDGGIVGACARKGVALTPSSSSPAPTPALVTTSTGATIGHQRRAARSARFVGVCWPSLFSIRVSSLLLASCSRLALRHAL